MINLLMKLTDVWAITFAFKAAIGMSNRRIIISQMETMQMIMLMVPVLASELFVKLSVIKLSIEKCVFDYSSFVKN